MRKKIKTYFVMYLYYFSDRMFKNTKANRKLNTSNSVDKVLNEQINNSTKRR